MIEIQNSAIITLIHNIFNKKNCGVIKLSKEQLNDATVIRFIMNIREKFIGDIIPVSLSDGKPVQLIPILNFQQDINRLNKQSSMSIGENIINNLHEIEFRFIQSGDVSIDLLINFLLRTENITALRISGCYWNYYKFSELLCFLNSYTSDKTMIVSYKDVNSNLLNIYSLSKKCTLYIHVDFPFEQKIWDTIWFVIKQYPCHIIFDITSNNDYNNAKKIVSKYEITNFRFSPFYTSRNIRFFQKQVFLTKESILSEPLSLKEIYAHQIINTFDFGKLTVLSNGDVYANINFPSLGNIATHSIHELLYKEMTEGNSWLRIRDQKPCSECVYQWLCPSPSDYELIIGKPNLCHVKP
jgi:pseudo-rSAM protein